MGKQLTIAHGSISMSRASPLAQFYHSRSQICLIKFIKMNIYQSKLFKEGMSPVYREGAGEW